MKLDDQWIRENIGTLPPGSAKFLLDRVAIGKLSVSKKTARLLEAKANGSATGPAARPLDWAERAAGERAD